MNGCLTSVVACCVLLAEMLRERNVGSRWTDGFCRNRAYGMRSEGGDNVSNKWDSSDAFCAELLCYAKAKVMSSVCLARMLLLMPRRRIGFGGMELMNRSGSKQKKGKGGMKRWCCE